MKTMAYQIKTNENGDILVSTVTKAGKASGTTTMTREVLDAVRDHLLIVSGKENKDVAFGWEYPEQDAVLILKLEQKKLGDIKQEEGE